MNICVFLALSFHRLIIFVLIHTIFVQLLLLKILVCIFAETSNGPITYNIIIYSTANVCAYQIMRAFSTKNIWTLLKAFITYVRPKLKYNLSVWNPYLKKDVYLLESIQKKFSGDVFIR